MPAERKDFLYDAPVHLADGTPKRFGDLTRAEMHAFMDAIERDEPQAAFDACVLRLRALAVSVEERASARILAVAR